MPSYAIFGGRLESGLHFDGLDRAGEGPPTWRLHVREIPHPPENGTPLGTARVDDGVTVRLYRRGQGYRLAYEDTGVFDIEHAGSLIAWYRPAGVNVDNARQDVLGRVMAVALHAGGDFCLHASAVLTPQGAVGFLAPKFHGKSTLAMALVHAGCRTLTDDILPIGFANGRVFARPGVPRLRLWSDSARRLAPDRIEDHISGKHTMDSLPSIRAADATFPLAALYLLSPRASGSTSEVVARHHLSSVQSALALVGQTKVGELLGGYEAPDLLQRAVLVAERIPMYRLDIVRGFERIAEAAARLVTWHKTHSPTAASA